MYRLLPDHLLHNFIGVRVCLKSKDFRSIFDYFSRLTPVIRRLVLPVAGQVPGAWRCWCSDCHPLSSVLSLIPAPPVKIIRTVRPARQTAPRHTLVKYHSPHTTLILGSAGLNIPTRRSCLALALYSYTGTMSSALFLERNKYLLLCT